MFIAYLDESGDEGYPNGSSDYFILSCMYMPHGKWQDNYDKLLRFRRFFKKHFRFPVKLEMHAKQFLQNKNPYHNLYSDSERKTMIEFVFKVIAKLDVKIVNVVIDKQRLTSPGYDVLSNAMTYLVQRIENDMNYTAEGAKFMIITDEGRVEKMTHTTRKIQRINYIPSMYSDGSYKKEIKNLLEDPLPKKSTQSYFIQLCDCVSYIVKLYADQHISRVPKNWPKRVLKVLSYGDEKNLLTIVRGQLNLKASKKNEFGIVYYPR